MDLDLTEDQLMIAQGAAAVSARHAGLPHEPAYYIASPAFEHDLATGGFVAPGAGLGPLEALLIVEQIARSPFVVEIAVSSLLAAAVPAVLDLPRPVAITRSLDRPIRFLQPGGTLLLVSDSDVRAFAIDEGAVAPVTTPFAYPYARPIDLDPSAGRVLDVSPAIVAQWWRVAIACEIAAAGRAALDLTVEHVKTREQFGRPIGSFQAMQHRLAICAVMVEAAEISARRAAVSGKPVDAAMAASVAQDAAANLHHECAQFHGAMGLTLEAPVHYFTYRLKALQGELGGLPDQALAVANHLWSAGQEES